MIIPEHTLGVIHITIYNDDQSAWVKEIRYITTPFRGRGIAITSSINPTALRTHYSLRRAFENHLGSFATSRLSSESFITE